MAMMPRGEVGLIFVELGRASGIFGNEIYAGVVIVIALTTLLPPFVMKWYFGRYGQPLPNDGGALEDDFFSVFVAYHVEFFSIRNVHVL